MLNVHTVCKVDTVCKVYTKFSCVRVIATVNIYHQDWPGALFGLKVLIAEIITSIKKSLYLSSSIPFLTVDWRPLVNWRLGSWKFPFFNKYKTTSFGLMEFGLDEVFFLLVRLLMVDQAFLLECFISMPSTVDNDSLHFTFGCLSAYLQWASVLLQFIMIEE